MRTHYNNNGSGMLARWTLSGFIASAALLLAACGGGGDSVATPTPTPPAPQPQLQTIVFATAGPVSRPLTDGGYTNVASGGAGTGVITYQSTNTTVATVNASGVVTFVTAGSTTITADKAADANYLAATASYSLTVTSPPAPQPQTIAFANIGPVSRPLADGGYTNVASGGAGTGAISYQSTNIAVATVNTSGVVTFIAAGSTNITATKAADANYLAATASYSLSVTPPPAPAPQPQSIAFASIGPVSRPLTDGGYTNVASGGAGSGAITYQSTNTTVATVNTSGVVTFVSAGSTTITADKAADANYLAATASYLLTITPPPAPQPQPAPQTIAFATIGPVSRPLADGSYTNLASGGAGTGALTYQSSNTAVATVNGSGVVTFVTAGSTNISATKAADANYLAATASYSLTITETTAPQPQSIAFADIGPVSRPLADGSYTNVASGGAGSGAIAYQSANTAVATVNALGVVIFVAAGSTIITAEKAADANYLAATASYSLTITSPPAPQPQTITFATAGPVSRPLADGSYTNVASGGAGTGALTYQSSNIAVATVNSLGVVTFVTAGSINITATKAADANYLAATASYSLTITSPPAPQPQSIAFANIGPVSRPLVDGSYSNAASGGAGTGAISYQSSNTAVATVNGSGVVTFAAAGSTNITATKAADANYLAAAASYSLTITAPQGAPPPPPLLVALNPKHLLGDVFFGDVVFQEPNGLSYTVTWDLGDGGSATGATVKHVFASAGTYTARVTVTTAAGHAVSAQKAIEVMPVVAQPAPIDNIFQTFCAGDFCGAVDSTTYSGSGVGVWRYHNATSADATINVAIDGLHVGQSGFLVFSNGSDSAAASVPGPGTALSGSPLMKMQSREDVAHEQIQARNRAMLGALTNRSRSVPRKIAPTAPVARAAAPPIGTTRVWRDIYGAPVNYNIEVAASCLLSTGRSGVVWMDANQVQRGELDPARVQLIASFLCGANGAYERLVALNGDIYGDAAAGDPGLIQDAPGNLQDLNVVILGVPRTTAWNGYFLGNNLVSGTQDPNSNHALSVVLNGWYLANSTEDDPAIRNTLAHELKHLINFYQRGLTRGAHHAPWLEETSAMLAEELIGAELSSQSRTDARIGGYANSGGGIGYIDWTHPEGNSYNLGGTFGSFLHRRYGTALDTFLMNTCTDDGTPRSSYQCVNTFIMSNGGVSFADEFARVGASALGRMSGPTPRGFGFPGSLAGIYRLRPTSRGAFEASMTPPRSLAGVYRATTHSYEFDFMDAGQTRFARTNLVIPAGTTLMVVVNDVAQ